MAAAVIALGLTVLFILPRQVWPLLSFHFGIFSVLCSFPSGLFFWYYAKFHGSVNSDFFGTAGQVLPIFVLAVLIDMGMSGSSTKINLVWYIILIAFGEFWSLFALAFDDGAGPYQFGVVCGAFVGGFIGLTMSILARAVRD